MIIRAYDALARFWIAVLFGNLTILFFIVFGVFGPDIPEGAPSVIDLQLAFDQRTFGDILDQWGPAAVDQYADTMWLDYLFPVVYVLFLVSALATLSADPDRYPGRVLQVLCALPVLAALGDYLENTLHLIILYDPATLPPVLIGVASAAAAVKWSLLGGVMIAVIGFFLRRVVEWQIRRQAAGPR